MFRGYTFHSQRAGFDAYILSGQIVIATDFHDRLKNPPNGGGLCVRVPKGPRLFQEVLGW